MSVSASMGQWLESKPDLARTYRFIRRYENAIIFLSGFLFDVFTIKRIDSFLDLLLQFLYLGALTLIIVYQYRERRVGWTPSPRLAFLWRYNVEALHFFYGGLFSAYVVLYFKSASGSRPIVFFALLVLFLFINEMPQIRRYGHRLRLGLYALCVTSFMIYLVPIVIGRMGHLIFALSLVSSGVIVWYVAKLLARSDDGSRDAQMKLFAPAAVVLIVITTLYVNRLIPPVPLSVQYAGVYHNVARKNGHFELTMTKPPFYAFWRKQSRPFRAEPGDRIVYFVRIFAPARFRTEARIRWELWNPTRKRYETSDLIPLPLTGGRTQGFRGYVNKSNITHGKWRVSAETSDGRPISVQTFNVVPNTKERRWKTVIM